MTRRALLLTLAASLFAPEAHAQTAEEACLSAEVDAQKLQRKGRLLDARKRYVDCAQPTCPSEVVQFCSQKAAELAVEVPSVVVVARDGANRDLQNVRVLVDGALVPNGAAGGAIELDPGAHAFRFERDKAPSVAQQITVHAGEKGRKLVVTFPDTTPPPAPRGAPTSSYVLAGVGAVALAVLGYAGIKSLEDRSAFGCATLCPSSAYDRVRNEYLVADVALGVAVISLAAAAWLYFSRPGELRPSAPSVTGRLGRAHEL